MEENLKTELKTSNPPDEHEDNSIPPREPAAEVYTYSDGHCPENQTRLIWTERSNP
jgi:hypothetical protein